MSKSTDWSNLQPDGTAYRDGLDDGPPLPSEAARERAYAAIKTEITDAERLNWLERTKYLQLGIGYDGYSYAAEVRFNKAGLKRFFGRSLRAAIDAAIQVEGA